MAVRVSYTYTQAHTHTQATPPKTHTPMMRVSVCVLLTHDACQRIQPLYLAYVVEGKVEPLEAGEVRYALDAADDVVVKLCGG